MAVARPARRGGQRTALFATFALGFVVLVSLLNRGVRCSSVAEEEG